MADNQGKIASVRLEIARLQTIRKGRGVEAAPFSLLSESRIIADSTVISVIGRIDADFAGFGLSAVFDRKMRVGENEEGRSRVKLAPTEDRRRGRESEFSPTAREYLYHFQIFCNFYNILQNY